MPASDEGSGGSSGETPHSLINRWLHILDKYAANTPAWLIGAEMAVASAALAAIGMALLRSSHQHRKNEAKEEVEGRDRMDSVDYLSPQDELLAGRRHPSKRQDASAFLGKESAMPLLPDSRYPRYVVLWLGIIFYIFAGVLNVLALTYAPLTTVAPLGLAQLVANVPLAYGVLNERFSQADLIATSTCIIGMAVVVIAMPRSLPGHLKDFPVARFIEFCDDMTNNYGFMMYSMFWVLLVCSCLLGNCVIRSNVRRQVRALTMPTLAGCFTSASAFFVKLFATLYYHSERHPEVWDHRSTYIVTCVTAVVCLFSLFVVYRGLRWFDCRYFVPASFTMTTVLMLVNGLLFFREWEGMTQLQLICFTVGCTLSVTSVFFISAENDTVHEPRFPSLTPSSGDLASLDNTRAGDETPTSPSPGGQDWPNAREITLLTIMEEHGARALENPGSSVPGPSYLPLVDVTPDAGTHRAIPLFADVVSARTAYLESRCGQIWNLWCQVTPLLLFVSFPVLVLLLFQKSYVWEAFLLLTLYSGFQAWKFSLHFAIFSQVGVMKIEAYSRVNFQKLYKKLVKHPESPEAQAPMPFDEVMHFLILTNYKEDTEIMREALLSAAKSQIARQQICVVLAMEEREEGAAQKAESLLEDLRSDFRHGLYTMHPAGIPGETPGKSANCRWAANKLFEEHLPRLGYDRQRVVITVMDADSEFHPEYFAALTYQFLTAPGNVRYCTIFQPPIIHYKNYHTQPAIVRLCSVLTTQHELANLADPTCTRMPYSTYSISAGLAHAVGGWDPDWISEDWHMCLKCFLGTSGALSVCPVFLPVMNYTPEGSTLLATLEARWTQAKRHALGVSELVYFGGMMPWMMLEKNLNLRQRFRMAGLGFFIYLKMLLVHGMLATGVIVAPINGYVCAYFFRHNIMADVNSFAFLANCVFQFCSAAGFMLYLYTSVRLYDKIAYRVVGYDDKNVRAWWGRQELHFLSLLFTSGLVAPIFFYLAGLTEWIAAVKTAATHKFHYEVALKPQVAAAKVQPSE
jgi:drug/metabolite transporter (DMT)-like permease